MGDPCGILLVGKKLYDMEQFILTERYFHGDLPDEKSSSRNEIFLEMGF